MGLGGIKIVTLRPIAQDWRRLATCHVRFRHKTGSSKNDFSPKIFKSENVHRHHFTGEHQTAKRKNVCILVIDLFLLTKSAIKYFIYIFFLITRPNKLYLPRPCGYVLPNPIRTFWIFRIRSHELQYFETQSLTFSPGSRDATAKVA
jgi:hypothetical protein